MSAAKNNKQFGTKNGTATAEVPGRPVVKKVAGETVIRSGQVSVAPNCGESTSQEKDMDQFGATFFNFVEATHQGNVHNFMAPITPERVDTNTSLDRMGHMNLVMYTEQETLDSEVIRHFEKYIGKYYTPLK